jgi:hypothetical protein
MDENLIDRLHRPLTKRPTHPTEDTDRPYPEGSHQRGPTHPTEDTDRPYPESFHQRGPTHPTEEDTDNIPRLHHCFVDCPLIWKSF